MTRCKYATYAASLIPLESLTQGRSYNEFYELSLNRKYMFDSVALYVVHQQRVINSGNYQSPL